ncbi:Serine/threonine-protein kinase [Basidiobolus ranarum]|uniref:non-specific serine/threonine protein kinase n=1 Tax=Basidiobolus ranarum TaxID=34480 RepID=A0ABR2WWV9_9FUNG
MGLKYNIKEVRPLPRKNLMNPPLTIVTENPNSKGLPTPAGTPKFQPNRPYVEANILPEPELPVISERQPRPRRRVGNYQLTKTLGAGSMGKVKLGVHQTTGEKIAVKIIHKRSSRDPNRQRSATDNDENKETRVIREASIMSLLNHPHIAKLKEMTTHTNNYYLFLEYVSGGQLLDYIISHGRLREKHARVFARQLCSALDYCHRNSIVHRDLKIENILISSDGAIKLIDFGLSNVYSTKSQLSTFCGSLYFAAPELLHARAYTGPEVDIWSLGIVIYVLLCGKVPFDDKSMPALHAKIKRGHVDYPPWLSKESKNLLSRILMINPSERATLQEVLQHPWMVKGYNGPPDSYVPHRTPIQLPLDPEIIQKMTGFQFGESEEIVKKLETIISSEAYQEAARLDTLNRFLSPLVSIYYLVKEKFDREGRESNFGSSTDSFGSRNPDPIQLELSLTPTSTSVTTDLEKQAELNRLSHAERVERAAARAHIAGSDGDSEDLVPEMAELSIHKNNSIKKVASKTKKGVFRRLSQALRPSKSSKRRSKQGTSDEESPNDPKSNTAKRGVGRSKSVFTPKNPTNTDDFPSEMKFDRRRNDQLSRYSNVPTRVGSLREANRINETESDSSSTRVKTRPPLVRLGSTPSPLKVEPSPEPRAPISDINKSYISSKDRNRADSYTKPVFLKGLFSVSTTSTKKVTSIRADIVRVLDKLQIVWREGRGYFECVQVDPSVNKPADTPNPPMSSLTVPTLFESSSNEEIPVSPTSSAGNDSEDEFDEIANRGKAVRFEIQIVKIPLLLGLHGLQFRRLTGHPWEYREACTKVLSNLKL